MKVLWFLLLSAIPIHAADVRNNGGNCIGVKSCRPRCVTFQVERDVQNCASSRGIFAVEGDINPWDIKQFRSRNCVSNGSCENNLCGQSLSGDMTVRIGEEGHHGSYFFTNVYLPDGGNDRFTFCSAYPCTKEECALPEQMGFALQLSFFGGSVEVNDFDAIPILILDIHLKAAFIGSPLHRGSINRYGPVIVEWMDDPAGCRLNEFPVFAPVAPPADPITWTNNANFDSSLYCEGSEYFPAALPMAQPTGEPSMAPSMSPTMSSVPSVSPTYSVIGQEQLEGLASLYNSTQMYSPISREKHDWFKSADYCGWTGITCDERGYVIIIDLTDTRLAGVLPSDLSKLGRLRQLKVVNNRIGGTIPEQLCDLKDLGQVELGTNRFTGTIPPCLHTLPQLRRLMLQFNSLEGTIPLDFCSFNQLLAFDISGNLNMYGEIPPCMGQLPLEVLRVENVGLVGKVPPQLCGRTFFNGVFPNIYDCAVVACPAGTFEPSHGRTYSNETSCITCEFPSNVIGSTSCKFVQNNTVISVTSMPSTSPSAVDSDYPTIGIPAPSWSVSPSDAPTQEPEPLVNATPHPSEAPSVPPTSSNSAFPSATPSALDSSVPSLDLSSAPSFYPTEGPEIVLLTAVFPGVTETQDEKTIEKYENATQNYLEISNGAVIYRVSVRAQSIGDASLMTHLSTRRLQSDALVLDLQIEGRSTAGTLDGTVQEMIVEEFTNYYNFIVAEVPALSPGTPSPAPIYVQELQEFVNEERKNDPNWWLLGSALMLSAVAVFAVLFVRKSKRSREEARAFPVEQLAAPASLTPPPRPQQSAEEDGLSAESSSGWNSETSPGEFVNDRLVREWTSGQGEGGMNLMTKQQDDESTKDSLV